MKKIINVGIVAHVDAGKTSLTESLYSHTHQEYTQGSIKKGTTITDTMELEKERGITIKTAAVSMEYQGTKINLIDMPGHIEFFGEVVRSLNVIDVAVLVVSSVGELPTQTRRIFDTLTEAGIPIIFFLNKIDIKTASPNFILSEITNKMTGDLIKIGTSFDEEAKDLLIERDERLINKFMNNQEITMAELRQVLKKEIMAKNIYPVILGSAVSGEGIEVLLECLSELDMPIKNSTDVSAYLYKVAFVNGQKQAFFKLLSGTMKRYESYLVNQTEIKKINRLFVLHDNHFVLGDCVQTGDIFMFPNWKYKIGSTIGKAEIKEIKLPEPTLKLSFQVGEKERIILLDLLTELTEEDPLINVNIDEKTSEISVRIFGRVQREYLEETLRRRYPFETLVLSLPTIVYQEMLKGKGVGTIEVDEELNPYWATMTLKIEPSNQKGIQFESLVTTGYLKQSFQNAIEESVYQSTKTGIYDFELTNVKVTLTDAEFFSPVSTPSEFRKLTPYALYKALLDAETKIVEPIITLNLTGATRYLGKAISEIGKLDGQILEVEEDQAEFKLAANLSQSSFLEFEERANEMFNGQAYLKGRMTGYQEAKDLSLYKQGKVDRIKSLLIKEDK